MSETVGCWGSFAGRTQTHRVIVWRPGPDHTSFSRKSDFTSSCSAVQTSWVSCSPLMVKWNLLVFGCRSARARLFSEVTACCDVLTFCRLNYESINWETSDKLKTLITSVLSTNLITLPGERWLKLSQTKPTISCVCVSLCRGSVVYPSVH